MSRNSHEKLNRQRRLAAEQRELQVSRGSGSWPWRKAAAGPNGSIPWVEKPRKKRRKKTVHTGPKETWEQFLARGGQVTQVAPRD